MEELFHQFLSLDTQLDTAVEQYGNLTYLALFAVVFAETGLVIFPFLPGDSLLFAVGAVASRGTLDLWQAMTVLFAAAVIGDNTNYWIGRSVGPRLLRGRGWRLLNEGHLEPARLFFKRHGGKAVSIGRFVPLVRTFLPFTAGVGVMDYKRFVLFDTFGAVLWVGVCVPAGYLFGNIPFVNDNFSWFVLVIAIASLVPALIGVIRVLSVRAPAATAKPPA
jgi:membrane-associated protein